MTKLIYTQPIEFDGKVIVSTEVLTHFKCYGCGKWSTVSSIELADHIIVHCTYCGGGVELPPMGINLVGNREPTQAEIDYGKTLEPLARELLEEPSNRDEFTERVIKSLDGDAGWPHFIDPGLMTK